MGPGRRAVMTLTAAAALAGCGSAMGATREGSRAPTSGRALRPVRRPSEGRSLDLTLPEKPLRPLRPGDRGRQVTRLQRELAGLGYWVGEPDGSYGHVTEQAVMALQKAAGIERDGVLGRRTITELTKGTVPKVRSGPRNRVEVDLERQLLLVVRRGELSHVINTSTGSGEPYTSSAGNPAIAVTPTGTYEVGRVFDGMETAKLGQLYRPRYFHGGYAVHGSGHIPGYPASHGCARVSNAAMDLIWSKGLMEVGSTVVVR